jgi:hypothetical protein
MSRPLLSLVVAILLLSVGCLSAHAATFYVSTAGADSVTCAKAQNAQTPRRTINAGIACLAGGDTLIVGGGTYDECLNDYGPTPIPAGTSWATATIIKSAPGEAVWLKVTAGCLGGGAVIEADKNHYIVFDGLNVDANSINGYGLGTSSNYIRFQNMEVKNSMNSGLQIAGSYNEFINLDIHNCGFGRTRTASDPNYGHGMYVTGWYNLIDRTKIHDNAGNGIQFTCEGCVVRYNTIQRSDIYNNTSNWGVVAHPENYVYNNIILNNRNGIHLGSSGRAAYNVVYNNGEIGIWPEGSNQEIKNNIVFGHRWDILDQGASSVDVASNICTAVGAPSTIGCTRAASPATVFQDISVKDFHLRAGSPAIGVGVPVSAPNMGIPPGSFSPRMDIDKDGVLRPPTGGSDVGAYQYAPQGPAAPAPQRSRAIVQ